MKKKIVAVIFMAALILCVSACGNTSQETQVPSISIDEYKSMVSEFNEKIMDESILLANVGMYEYSWWGAFSGISNEVGFGDIDYEAMVESAMKWLSENSDSNAETVKSTYDELIASCAAIDDANVEGEVPDDISEFTIALFGAYSQLYTTVTEPSGSIEDFLLVLRDSAEAVTVFNADLASALNEF